MWGNFFNALTSTATVVLAFFTVRLAIESKKSREALFKPYLILRPSDEGASIPVPVEKEEDVWVWDKYVIENLGAGAAVDISVRAKGKPIDFSGLGANASVTVNRIPGVIDFAEIKGEHVLRYRDIFHNRYESRYTFVILDDRTTAVSQSATKRSSPRFPS